MVRPIGWEIGALCFRWGWVYDPAAVLDIKLRVLNGGPMRRSGPTKAFNFQPLTTRLLNPKGEKRGEYEAGSSEGDDVEAVNLREELHRTTDDDGDENLGKNDEEIKDSHVHAHFR